MINILGQNYDYQEIDARNDPKMEGLEGYCDGFAKTIRVNHSFSNSPSNTNGLDEYKKLVKRHEVIHAFFHESGFADDIANEQIVEWIAKQFPKMVKIFEKIKAI